MTKIGLAVVAALVLAGCSATPPSAGREPAPATLATPPAKTGAEQAVVGALEKVDAGLTKNFDRAVRRSKSVCESFARYDGDETKIVDYVRQEFDGGTVSVDAGKAVKILTAIRGSGFCG